MPNNINEAGSESNEQDLDKTPGDTKVTAESHTEDRSERLLDREEDAQNDDFAQQKSQQQAERLAAAGSEDKQRSDNQQPAEQKLDGDDGENIEKAQASAEP